MICKSAITCISAALLFSATIPTTSGFSILHTKANAAHTIKKSSVKSPLTGTVLYSTPEESSQPPAQFESPVSKFFQLEEKEDRDSSTTEIFLSANGTVSIGMSDAPPPLLSTGTWSQDGQDFEMQIKRTFGAGQSNTDVGEFKFVVERGFVGRLDKVGNLLSIDGSMHIKQDISKENMEVGFFSMIDTTVARLMEDDEDKKGMSLTS
eukprot:scaffold3764_cov195-Chaetoceros_neogracile.AAC.1